MKNRLRLLSAFCAMIMSASIVVPVFAISPECIDRVETRLKEALDHLNHSVLNAGGEEKEEVEKLLNDTKLTLDSNRAQLSLLSDDDEKVQSTFLSLHNNIDQALNIIDISNLNANEKVKIYVLDEEKLSCLRTKVDSIGKTKCGSEHGHIYQKYRQVVERFYHLDVCFGYSDQNFSNSSSCLSVDHQCALIDKFERNIKEVNKYLEKIIKDIDDAVKMDNLDVFNQLIEEIHDNINMYHIYLSFFDGTLEVYKEIDNEKEENKEIDNEKEENKEIDNEKEENKEIDNEKEEKKENDNEKEEKKENDNEKEENKENDNEKEEKKENDNKKKKRKKTTTKKKKRKKSATKKKKRKKSATKKKKRKKSATKKDINEQITESKSPEIEDGIYTIESKLDSNKCLDIQNASKDDYANLQLFEKNSTNAQKFKVKYNEEAGYYTVTAMCSDKPLDVALAGKDWGTNIQQYSCNDNDAQKWYIVSDGQGYYSIVSKCNGLCVDLSNADTANGTNIQCWDANGTDAQKFKLVKS